MTHTPSTNHFRYEKHYDEEAEAHYFVHVRTGASQWSRPKLLNKRDARAMPDAVPDPAKMSPRVHEAAGGVAAEAAAKARSSADPAKLVTDHEVTFKLKLATVEASDFDASVQTHLKAVLAHNLGLRPAYIEVLRFPRVGSVMAEMALVRLPDEQRAREAMDTLKEYVCGLITGPADWPH